MRQVGDNRSVPGRVLTQRSEGDLRPTTPSNRSEPLESDGMFRRGMTCAFCHSEIPDTQPFNFCPFCGQTIMAVPDPIDGRKPFGYVGRGIRIEYPLFWIGVTIGVSVDTNPNIWHQSILDGPSSVPVAADPGHPAVVTEIGDDSLDLRKGHAGGFDDVHLTYPGILPDHR